MKRIYMALVALLFATTGAIAQRNADLSITLTTPDSASSPYSNLSNGSATPFTIEVTNNGPDDLLATDTIRMPFIGLAVGQTTGSNYILTLKGTTNGLAAGATGTFTYSTFNQGTVLGTANGESVSWKYPTNDTGFYYVGVYGQEADGTYFTDAGINNDTLESFLNDTVTSFESTFMASGSNNYAYNWAIFGSITGVGNIAGLPKESLNVYPNPITAGANLNIKYAFTSATEASIRVTDISGRTLVVKNIGKQGIGEKTFGLNLNSLPSGNYFVELVTNNKRAIAQVVLSK